MISLNGNWLKEIKNKKIWLYEKDLVGIKKENPLYYFLTVYRTS